MISYTINELELMRDTLTGEKFLSVLVNYETKDDKRYDGFLIITHKAIKLLQFNSLDEVDLDSIETIYKGTVAGLDQSMSV